MIINLPSGGAVIGRGPLARAGRRYEYPRLVLTESAAPTASARNWVGTVGNTLLETPWLVWSVFDMLVVERQGLS